MFHRDKMIMPSILACDFANIGLNVQKAISAGCASLHLDVMDGHFVPAISFGAQMIAAVKAACNLTLDVHLMTENPDNHIESMQRAGADRITFHIETEVHAHRLITRIQNAGMACGIALVPSTPVLQIKELIHMVDQVLVMTVNPGWGGQKLIPEALNKVQELGEMRTRINNKFIIVIDGGFAPDTAEMVWESGTDVAIMGSAFFSAPDTAEIIRECLNTH